METYPKVTAIRLGKEQCCEINQADLLLRRDRGRRPITSCSKTLVVCLSSGVVAVRMAVVSIRLLAVPELHHLRPILAGEILPFSEDSMVDNCTPTPPA